MPKSQTLHIDKLETLMSQHQQAFDALAEMLAEENKHTNLTRITDPQQVRIRHFLDSLAVLPILDGMAAGCECFSVADVGSGAGFPSLPLAIVRPEWRFVSIEATGKKVHFQQKVAAQLGLKTLTVLHGRAEDIAHQPHYRQQFDAALARAVADLRVLAEISLGLVKVGGAMLAFKGPDSEPECTAAEKSITVLGGKLFHTYQYTLPGVADAFRLIAIHKINPTPDEYPRSYSVITRKPLA
ncbi:MAG: 16S rRNA (guanine(527)-N(7))-methyltransferase RsmG [Anaerohalosphaeraceae bacterium]